MSYEDRQSQKNRDLARKHARTQKWSNLGQQPVRVQRPQPDSYQPRQSYRKTGS